jgi:hypothetical protein
MGSFRGAALATVLTALAALPASAQDPSVSSSFAASGVVSVDDPVTLELSRELSEDEGHR